MKPSHSHYTVEFNNNGDTYKSSMEFSTIELAEHYYDEVSGRYDNAELCKYNVDYKILHKKGRFNE